jgi:hypothetical protein
MHAEGLGKVEAEAFVTAVIEYFVTESRWPAVGIMQRQFKHAGRINRLALLAGHDMVRCDDPQHPDAVCKVTLEGLRKYGGASSDLQNFADACRICATRELEGPREEISSQDLASELGLDGPEARRLGLLLHDGNSIWTQASGPDSNGEFRFWTNREIWYFEDVHSIDDYFTALERAATERQEEADLRNRSWFSDPAMPPHAVPQFVSEAPLELDADSLTGIQDPQLMEMLRADVVEITAIHKAGAWKSVALLSGSCCEAILVDFLRRDPERTRAVLKDGWESSKGLSELVKAAVNLGVISDQGAEAANVIKKWRDLIHPVRASKTSTPTRQSADILIALLKYLIWEANKKEPGQV